MQAAFHRGVLRACDLPADVESEVAVAVDIPYVYFGTFDGHAGSGCAVTAANELHVVLHRRLLAVLQHLVGTGKSGTGDFTLPTPKSTQLPWDPTNWDWAVLLVPKSCHGRTSTN